MAEQATAEKSAKPSAFNVQADIRDNGSTLLIVVDLTGPTRQSATGKSVLLAGTGFPVRVTHPELGEIWYSCTVGHETAEYAELKAELAALRERRKAFNAKAKAAK